MNRAATFVAVLLGAAVQAEFTKLSGYDTSYETTVAGADDVDIFVKKGDKVKVHATGIVEQSGKKFWSTKDPGQQPFEYQAGVGGVITGWDQGCLGKTVALPCSGQLCWLRLLTLCPPAGFPDSSFSSFSFVCVCVRACTSVHRHEAGRDQETAYTGTRRLWKEWLSGVGHPARRHASVRN